MRGGALTRTKTVPLQMLGGENFARYPIIQSSSTTNFIVTDLSGEGALVPFPGYEKKINFVSGQPREIYVSTRLNAMVTVIGNAVYVVQVGLNYQLIGRIDTFEGPVYISENQNNQIGIVDGFSLYVYNYNFDTFTRIEIPGIIPSYISFLDTYTIITDTNRRIWIISSPNDMTMYSALNEETIQTQADQLQVVERLDRTVWVLGKKVGELWNDNPNQSLQGLGSVSFPFKRNNSYAINYGCLSQQSLSSGFGMLAWLAFNAKSGPTIVYTSGGKPNVISTEGLDHKLQNLSHPEISTGMFFKDNGHVFYMITFYHPDDDYTIVYDFNTKLWFYATDEYECKYIAKRMVFFNDKFYFINFDSQSPGIYEMSIRYLTYDGATVRRTRILDPIRFNDRKFIINRVEPYMEHGHNDDIRRIDLSVSFNGNDSFQVGRSSFVDSPQAHRIGQTKWYKLGLSNNAVLKFDFWSRGRFVVMNGEMDIII